MKSEPIDLKTSQDKRVAITGTAADAKAGAVLMTDREEVIYLRDMPSWPDAFLGRRTVVEGILRRGSVYPESKTVQGITTQGMSGEQWSLEAEAYRLAD